MLGKFALSCYKELFSVDFDNVEEIGKTVLIPKFPIQFVSTLIKQTVTIMTTEKPIVHTQGGNPFFMIYFAYS